MLGDFSFCPREVGYFFGPKRFGDFVLSSEVGWVFFVPRGWVIFFCPKKLGDYFLFQEVG